MLRVDDLSINRGGATVLQDINAALSPGQITAIVGPNGAGKSSLLMALAGLIEPQAGSVVLDDAPVAALSHDARAKAIGFLPQGADIAWDVSVEALVALGRMPHRDGHTTSGRGAVNAAIEALDLNTLRDRPVGQLSGGETARVLLARVLAGQPQWILADEPLAALDLAHQIHLIGYLRQCADTGTGVVIVVHDLAMAMNHADRVIVLDAGALAADGSPIDALSPTNIDRVWGIKTTWLNHENNPGQHALIASGPN
ncbi:ATP-binding cassette domain-containing protein [Erythrobacter sp. Alg231-14]|uniref:ATP-binding cassette domain-containing protein n=1 Tax=Erythrobacter sp. Alg231-14 TaxID=1922225 RepID=UPI000D54E1CB